MISRIWKGRKEMSDRPYYCGQIWEPERELWRTITAEFGTQEGACHALAVMLDMQKAEKTLRNHVADFERLDEMHVATCDELDRSIKTGR